MIWRSRQSTFMRSSRLILHLSIHTGRWDLEKPVSTWACRLPAQQSTVLAGRQRSRKLRRVGTFPDLERYRPSFPESEPAQGGRVDAWRTTSPQSRDLLNRKIRVARCAGRLLYGQVERGADPDIPEPLFSGTCSIIRASSSRLRQGEQF